MRMVSAVLWTVLWLGVASGAANAATYDTRVRWSASADSAGYRVYVRTSGGTYGAPLEAGLPNAAGDGSLAFVVPDVDVRTDYLYAVAAYGADGIEGARSNELALGYAQVAGVVDSDLDGLSDAQEDRNLNRVVDAGETDPQSADTDADGVGDGRDACGGTPAGEAVAADGCGCSQRVCNDGNACTTDTCTAGQCQNVAVTNGTSCADNTVCNGVETCQGGACVRTGAPNCDDGDSCTADTCNAVTGCMNTPIAGCKICTSPAQCDDGNTCTADVCSGGRCQNTPVGNGVSCSDGNACNGAETCQNGACAAAAAPNCDDANACTTDACSPTQGCSHAPIASCTACTTAAQCSDGNACTADTCVAGRCQRAPASNGTVCSDGNACNGAETCQSGTCTAGTAPNCDDSNVCTMDACSAGSGCTHVTIAGCTACTTAAQCNDNNACTRDTCSNGRCQRTAAQNGTSCADSNTCNGAETCRAGACVAGPAPSCDDGNACTVDTCVPGGGCTHEGIPGCCVADADCKDSSACTVRERCEVGRCVSDPLVCAGGACADGVCDPTLGCTTVPKPDGMACAGGDACGASGVCTTGACQRGGAMVAAATSEDFAVSRFVLRPAGKRNFDLTAEGSLEAPAFGALVPSGVDVELRDETGTLLYGIAVPGAALQPGRSDFVYARGRGIVAVPGLRRLQIRSSGGRVSVSLRASVPRSVGQSLRFDATDTRAAQGPSGRKLNWLLRLGGTCTRDADLDCPSTRSAIRRCD